MLSSPRPRWRSWSSRAGSGAAGVGGGERSEFGVDLGAFSFEFAEPGQNAGPGARSRPGYRRPAGCNCSIARV